LVLAFANGKTIETEAGTLTQPHEANFQKQKYTSLTAAP
jgi:hypothetical protein